MKIINFAKENVNRILIISIIVLILILFFISNSMISALFYHSAKIDNEIDNCNFEVDFIDVGQGDSILVRLPDNKLMLVDAGPENSSSDCVSFLKKQMGKFKKSSIDYMVLTHPDEDHIGGAIDILNNIKVNLIYRPKILTPQETELDYLGYGYSSTETYSNLIKHISFYYDYEFFGAGTTISGDDYSVNFLTPTKEIYYSTNEEDRYKIETNDYSPMIMLEYKEKKILLTGDASEEVENELIQKFEYTSLKVDILKVAHHGSKYSTSQEFLSRILPTYAIISVGANSYGHPSEEVLERLESVLVKDIYSTYDYGDIKIGINQSGEILIGLSSEYECIDLTIILTLGLIVIFFVAKLPQNTYKVICKNINKKNIKKNIDKNK